MKKLKILMILLVLVLLNFTESFSQYSRGNDVLIIVPQNNNRFAPQPLFTPDFNELGRLMKQRSDNYEQEMNMRRAMFDAMTPDQQRAYIERLKAEEAAEEENRVRQMKFERKIQTATYITVGVILLTYLIIK